MYVIRGRFKNENDKRTWVMSGYDNRPLKYTDYNIAHRECQNYQEQNLCNVKEYGDEEVIYEVINGEQNC